MRKFIRMVNRINEAMMWVVGTLLLFMGIITFYAVVMRYFFKKPPLWSYDLTGWLLGLSAFLGGGYALLKGAHVRVDILYEKFSVRTRSWIDAVTSIFLFLIVIVFVWKGMEQVINYYQAKTVATTGLNISVWILWAMVPLGGLLLGLQAIVNLLKDIYTIVRGKRLVEEEAN